MKKFISLLLVLSMMLLATACSKNNNADPTNNTNTDTKSETQTSDDDLTGELRITVQAWMMGKYDFEGIKADFEKNHPGVTVVYNKVDNFDVTTNMLQWMQGKTNCDIAIGGSREHAVQYAAKDYIVPFEDDFFTEDITKDKFFPAFLELGNVEGTQYMIPFTGEVMFIVANKALMKEAGLTDAEGNVIPPKTWDELYEYAKATTKVENDKPVQTGLSIDWGTNFMMYAYLTSLQGLKGNFYEADGKTIDFTSAESKAILEKWIQLVKDGYTPTDTFADMDAGRTNFKAGKVAMLMTAASRWIECEENIGDDNTAIIPIPGTDENGSLVYIHGVVIPKASPKIELAKLFIKEELLSSDLHINALNTYGKMSPLLAHYENLENPDWPTVVAATEKAVTTPLYKDYSRLDSVSIVEFQKCITGSQSIEDTQKNLSQLIQSLDLTTGLK